MSMLDTFVSANLVIAIGYMSLAMLTLPGVNPVIWKSLRIRLWWTRLHGFGFFLTCGLTHVEELLHAVTGEPMDPSSFHMVAIHVVQAWCVVNFIFGVYREVVAPYGLRVAPEAEHHIPTVDEVVAASHPTPDILAAFAYEPALLDHLAELEARVRKLAAAKTIWGVRLFLFAAIIALVAVILTQGWGN